jgi:drug/metabolite transporter (DMT)-like permease
MSRNTKSQKHIGITSTLLAISLLAGNGYFAKGLVSDTLTLTLVRSIIAAVFIFIFMRAQGQLIRFHSKKDLLICCLTGFLLGVHWLSFFYSMSISTVTLGMVTLYTYPVITLWLEVVLFEKKASHLDWLTSGIVVLGVGIIASDSSGSDFNNFIAIFMGLLSAFCFAARNVVQQNYLGLYPAQQTIFYQTLTIALLMGLVFGIQIESNMTVKLITQDGLQWLLLGIIFTALPHTLIATGIQKIGAKSVAVIGCLQPAVASIIAYLLLDEIASDAVILGSVIVLAGAFLEIKFHKSLEATK